MEAWEVFLNGSEEWLVAYCCTSDFIPGVKLFSIGHAFELHLKAAHAKLCGDVKKSVKFGHKIVPLWNAIKALDPDFLPEIELRKAILDTNILKGGQNGLLSQDDYSHFLRFQELYLIAQHLPDLKYLGGAPLKTAEGQIQFAFWSLNPMWAEIFGSIRRYLGRNQLSSTLAFLKADGEIPKRAIPFFEQAIGL